MMKWRTVTVVWILALALLLFAKRHSVVAEPLAVNSVLDLTHVTSESSLGWIGSKGSAASDSSDHEQHSVGPRELTLSQQFGTHLGAPARFAHGLWTVDQIPAERLVRPLVVINISRKAKSDSDYQVTVDDIAAWEDIHGHIPQGSVVLLRSGWGDRWHNSSAFRNVDAKGVMHFPGFSVEAAKFLVDARLVVGIGTDTMSVDAGDSRDFPVNRYCASRSVYHLENVANLEVTPESGATLIVAPAKLESGLAAPTRLLAMLK